MHVSAHPHRYGRWLSCRLGCRHPQYGAKNQGVGDGYRIPVRFVTLSAFSPEGSCQCPTFRKTSTSGQREQGDPVKHRKSEPLASPSMTLSAGNQREIRYIGAFPSIRPAGDSSPPSEGSPPANSKLKPDGTGRVFPSLRFRRPTTVEGCSLPAFGTS